MSQRGLDTAQLSYHTTHATRMAASNQRPAPLTDLSQYVISPGRRADPGPRTNVQGD